MPNPHDIARDFILRHLYLIHERARSPKTAGLKITDLARALKPKGFKLQEVASNLDYLVQKGWVREVVETRTFTTPRGTTQQAEKRSYKISDSGIDRRVPRVPVLHLGLLTFPRIPTAHSHPNPPANPIPRPTCTPLCQIAHSH